MPKLLTCRFSKKKIRVHKFKIQALWKENHGHWVLEKKTQAFRSGFDSPILRQQTQQIFRNLKFRKKFLSLEKLFVKILYKSKQSHENFQNYFFQFFATKPYNVGVYGLP